MGVAKRLDLDRIEVLVALDHQLRDAIADINPDITIRVINQHHTNTAAVVAIHNAGQSVEAVFSGPP